MESPIYAWERIFKREGRVLTELLPIFFQCKQEFKQAGVQRILDLGSGNGRHVVGFKKAGFEIVGFDISTTGLKLTHEWLAEENLAADLVVGDSRKTLPFAPETFDGLLSTQVIHHALLEDIRFTISEIWRVLTPGGIGRVSVAGRIHADTQYQEIEPGTFVPLDGSEKGLPHHIFSEKELRKEFSRFEILESGPRDEGRVQMIRFKKG